MLLLLVEFFIFYFGRNNDLAVIWMKRWLLTFVACTNQMNENQNVEEGNDDDVEEEEANKVVKMQRKNSFKIFPIFIRFLLFIFYLFRHILHVVIAYMYEWLILLFISVYLCCKRILMFLSRYSEFHTITKKNEQKSSVLFY